MVAVTAIRPDGNFFTLNDLSLLIGEPEKGPMLAVHPLVALCCEDEKKQVEVRYCLIPLCPLDGQLFKDTPPDIQPDQNGNQPPPIRITHKEITIDGGYYTLKV
ncbi:MAG: hypothetical protein QHH09_03780 [Microgenomates group bacterium]|jgi:hypothetical protein|nr:hypothetical protein [Microgenomates group bacterium]